jgi:cytochrome c553
LKKPKIISVSQSPAKNAITKFGMISAGLTVVAGLCFSAGAMADTPPKLVTEVCASCHGEDGNSAAPTFPKLAGQTKEYITKQLNNLIDKKRNNEIMSPIAATLKKSDIAGLADYFSSQKPTPATPDDKKLIAEGEIIFNNGIKEAEVPVCAGCHAPLATGNGLFPRLAGQHADYIVTQLKSFKTGERNNDVSRYMRVVSQRMNEDQMKAVAEYLSGLQ